MIKLAKTNLFKDFEKQLDAKNVSFSSDASGKDAEKDAKNAAPKKKVYEDEDEKAPFEMHWEGAPEFQWRCKLSLSLQCPVTDEVLSV